MYPIANPKNADMAPRWAPFAGFSVLFDNPGRAIRVVDGAAMLHSVAESDGPLDVYARLHSALSGVRADALAGTHALCPLPPSSYHVTVWDGVNAENLARVPSGVQQEWAAFLQELPGSLDTLSVLLNCVLRSRLLARSQSEVRFQFESLRIRGNQIYGFIALAHFYRLEQGADHKI